MCLLANSKLQLIHLSYLGLKGLILCTLLTLVMLNKDAMLSFNFQPIRLLDPGCRYKKFTHFMTNSADLDQLASSEANLSGSTLFAKAGHIWVQQD